MASTAFSNPGIATANSQFYRAPVWVNATAMTLASSAASLTIPAGGQYVRLTGTENFFAKWGSTGASTAAATDGTGSEYVTRESGGVVRNIGSTLGTTAISVISTAAACTVTQSWWTV